MNIRCVVPSLPTLLFVPLLLFHGMVLAEEPPAPLPDTVEITPLPAAVPIEVEQTVEQAHILLLQDQLDEARALLERVVQDHPDQAQAWHWLGQVLLKQQQTEPGIAALERSVQLAPLDPALRFELATAYELAQRPADAERLYQAMLGDDAVGIEARFRLGRLLSLQDRFDGAIETLDKVVAARDRAPERAAAAAALLDNIYNRRTDGLIADLENKPEADAYTRAVTFGITLMAKRRMELARRIFETAIKVMPQQAPGYYWLARIQITGGKMDEGLKNLEQSAVRAPDNFRLKLELGKAYDAAKRHDEAERTFKDILDHGREPAVVKEARRLYGLLRAGKLFQAQDWTGALAIFDSLLQDTPDDPRLLELKAQALEELGRHGETDGIFATLLERFPGDPVLRSRIAGAWERRGEVERAREQYVRVLQLQPSGEQARLALEHLGMNRASDLLQKNQPEEALKIFEPVLALAPDLPAANLGAGLAYHRLQRNDAAEAAFNKVLKADPNNLLARIELAQLYESTGRTEEASRAFEELERYARSADELKALRERLTALYSRESERVLAAYKKGAARDTEAAVSLGKRLVSRGFNEDAVKLLGTVLERAPGDAQVHFWLGKAYLGQGQADQGLAEIERSTQLAPDNFLVMLELADDYVRAGRGEDAERTLLTVIRNSDDAILRRQAGRGLAMIRIARLQNDRDYSGALAEYDKLLGDFPDDLPLLLERARVLGALNRTEEAAKDLARLLELAPGNLNLRLGVAQIYRLLKQPDQAEAIYTELLERAPGFAAVRLERARLYQENGRDFDALKDYGLLLQQAAGTEQGKQLLAAVDGYTRQLLQRGAALMTEKKLDEALDFFTKLAEVQPRNGQIHFWLSEVHKAQQHFDLQVQELEKVVELLPNSIVMKRRLAFACIEAGNTARATEVLNQLLEAFPYDSEVRLALGDLLEREGQHQEAHAQYVKLLELKPVEEWREKVLDRLGLEQARAESERGETDQAVATVQVVLAIAPDDPLAVKELARIYHKANRLEEAETAWRKVLAASPDDRNARLSLARILVATNREDEAIKLYFDLASEELVTSQRDDARKELDLLLVRRADRAIEEVTAGQQEKSAMETLLPLGVEALRLDSLDAAQRIFDHLVKQFPDNAEAVYWRGRVFAKRKRYADGLVFMQRSVELAPGNPLYLLGLGQAYGEMKLYTQAEQTLEQGRDLAPEDVEIHFALADLYQRRGETAQVEQEYAHALQYAADDGAVRRALAGLNLAVDPDQLSEDDQHKTLRLFSEVMSGPPRSAAARYYLAVVYQRQQRLTEAETALRAVLAMDGTHAGAALHLARLYADSGRSDEALALLQGLVSRGGDARVVQLAQQQISALLVARAQALGEQLKRGAGDVREARRLGRLLLERRQNEAAIALMEAAAPVDPDNAEIQYILGRAYVDLDKFDPGIAALERSVKLAPPGLEVTLRLQLALAYERAGRLKEAVAVNRELFELISDETQRNQVRLRLALLRARQLSQAGDNDAALREYDAVMGLFPDDVQLLTERGQLLARMGRNDEADRLFERVLALDPQNLAVRLRLAEVYNARGDQARLLPQVTTIIEVSPFGPEAQQARILLGYDKALAQLEANSLDDAQQTFERILTVIPKDPITRFDLGRTYFKQGKFAEAEDMLGGIIRDHLDNQETHYLLGSIYQGTERRDSAIAEYERAVELGVQTPSGAQALKSLQALYAQRAQELIASGEDEDALLSLNKLVQAAPDNLSAHANLVILYMRKQKYDEALQHVRTMIRLQPGNPAFYTQMGTIHVLTQRNAEAAESFAYAISVETDEEAIKRDQRELMVSLSRALLDEDQTFAAIRELNLMKELGLDDDRSNFILGVIYRQQNRFDEAAQALRDAVRENPDNVIMRYSLADIYERTNNYDLALLQYRQILRIGRPGDRIVEEVRPRANALNNRLALFNSQLQYGITVGDSNVEEQDINGTGAINSSFNSTLVYNLGTNFWPTDSLNLRLDTGVVYVTNHTNQTDTFVPRVGLAGNLNLTNTFYSASAMVSEIRSLLLDTSSGRTYNFDLSAGLRLRETPLEWLRSLRKKKTAETGETEVVRVSAVSPPAAPPLVGTAALPALAEAGGANTRLRDALLEVYRQQYPTYGVIKSGEPVRSYTVSRGDTLWNIATRFLQDPFMWRELVQLNPQVDNPDLIYPGELLFLEPPQAAPLFQQFDAAMMLEREENIRKSVDAVMVIYLTGEGFMQQGNPDEALKWFQLVLEIVPDDPMTLFNVGTLYHRKKEYTLAEHAYLAFVADPENQVVRLRLVDLYDEMDRVDEAIRMAEEVLRHNLGEQDRAAIHARLRRLYQRQADGLLAGEALSDQDAAALLELAVKLAGLPDVTAARTVLEGLLARRPDDAEANFRLAQVYLQLGDAQQALHYAANSAVQAPADLHYRLARARAARAAGDFDQAESLYGELAAQREESSLADTAGYELKLMRVERLESAHKMRQARDAYLRLLQQSPEDAELLVKVARLSGDLGLLKDGVDYYLKAIALQPDVLAYHLDLADIYQRAKQPDQAREQLVAALGLAVSAEDRRAVLDHLGFQDALAALRDDKPAKALEILRSIDTVMPDNALVQLNIGVAYQSQEKYPEAEAQFQRIIDADPDNLTALLRLGMVYAETGKIDRAIAVYERVITGGRGLPVADRAQTELTGLEKRRLRVLTGVDIQQSEPLVKTVRGRLTYSTSVLPQQSVTQVDSGGAGVSFVYPTRDYGNWILNYMFNLRENVNPLGTDYAYYSHLMGVTWQTPMPNIGRWFGSELFGDTEYIPGLTASLDISHERRYYSYFDTNYLNVVGRAETRRQTVTTLTAGLNYQFPGVDQISLYFNYTRGFTRSSLPVGIIFSPQGVPVSFQSPGLGDFDPNFFTTGFAFQF